MPRVAVKPRSAKFVGLGLVIIFHLVLIYALVNALARRNVFVAPRPIQAQIIVPEIEKPKPPPPPPPPQPKTVRPPPKPYVPPPEVPVAPTAPAPNAITGTTSSIPPRLDRAASRDPDYPPEARRLGHQGSVVLQVYVGLDGRVKEARIAQSSGFNELDQAALNGIQADYRFAPGITDGKPQAMWHTLRFTWRLR